MLNSTLDVEMLLIGKNLDPCDALVWDKFVAVFKLIPRIRAYLNEGLDEAFLIRPLALKKVEQITLAASKKELKEILTKPQMRYGAHGTYHPLSRYTLPEEELIYWMYTNYIRPLHDSEYWRYFELFQQVCPQQAEKMLSQGALV